MSEIKKIMDATVKAYSRERYGEVAWRKNIKSLLEKGFSVKDIIWIMESKYPRWARDRFDPFKVGKELIAYYHEIGFTDDDDKKITPHVKKTSVKKTKKVRPETFSLNKHRFNQNPLEQLFAKSFEDSLGGNRDIYTKLGHILDGAGKTFATDAEVSVAVTVIQWLGSPVGQCFLADTLIKATKDKNIVKTSGIFKALNLENVS